MAVTPVISEQAASPKSTSLVPWPEGDWSYVYRNINLVPWDIDLHFWQLPQATVSPTSTPVAPWMVMEKVELLCVGAV